MKTRFGLKPEQLRILVMLGVLNILIISGMGWIVMSTMLSSPAQVTSSPLASLSPTSASQPVPTKTPDIAPIVTQQIATEEETFYLEEVLGISESITAAMEKASGLGLLAGETPSVITTNEWRYAMAAELATISIGADEWLALDPPPSLRSCHTFLVITANHYNKAVDNFAYGVDNNNLDSIENSALDMKNANNSFADFTDCITTRMK